MFRCRELCPPYLLRVQAHRPPEGHADFLGLAGEERKVSSLGEAGRPLALLAFSSSVPFEEEVTADDRQAHADVFLGIADHRPGLTAAGHELGLLQDRLAHHDDAAVALAQVILSPVGDRALSDPRDEVLIHDVRRDPAPGLWVLDRAVPVWDPVLREGFDLVGHPVEEPADAQHVLVVDGHAPLEVTAGEETVRPETRAPDRPELVALGLSFEDAPVSKAVLELVEADPQVRRRLVPVEAVQGARPVRVQPLEVHGVDGVLLALEPVARDFREHDLDEAVLPGEGFPGGHERRGWRPEVRPQQARLRFYRIGLETHAVLEARLRMGDFLEGLVQTPAGVVPPPTVVVTAQAAVLDPAIRQIRPSMRAMSVDQAVVARPVLVQDEILAHQPDRLDRIVVQLGHGGDGHPVSPQQLAHGRARADLGQPPVLLLAQHGPDSTSTLGIVSTAVVADALVLSEIDAFYGDSHVLHRVSLRLGEGRLLGLLGRNGAGKSTSMNVTVGLLPPRHGAVTVYGRVVTGRAPEAIAAQGVALVPQGRRIFRSLTVRENLAVAGRKPRGLPMLWTLEAVYGIFPRLRERQRQIAGSLSGGEQQMLAIGRALMSNPRVLLMDEP